MTNANTPRLTPAERAKLVRELGGAAPDMKPIPRRKSKLLTPGQLRKYQQDEGLPMTDTTAREKLKEIAEQRALLDAEAADIRAEVLAELRSEITSFGFTADDLFPPATRSHKARSDRPIAYRDPATGETWTGFGKRPNWLKAHEEAGRNREKYLVK